MVCIFRRLSFRVIAKTSLKLLVVADSYIYGTDTTKDTDIDYTVLKSINTKLLFDAPAEGCSRRLLLLVGEWGVVFHLEHNQHIHTQQHTLKHHQAAQHDNKKQTTKNQSHSHTLQPNTTQQT